MQHTDVVFEPQVLVVDFHHARGPEVQFWITPEGESLYQRNDWSLISFLALADGTHAVAEDFSYFTLLNQSTQSSDLSSSSGDRKAGTQSNGKTLNTLDAKSEIFSSTSTELAASNEISEVGVSLRTGKGSKLGHAGKAGTTLFGIACTRQIRSELLIHKSPDVTRSTVQKAVVVILEQPVSLGAIRERLGAVTAAWFAQKDFTNIEILQEFQESLKRDVLQRFDLLDHDLGLSIREVIHEFRHQTLVMVKALLLQRKLLFFGSRCERLCLFQFALLALIPNLMQNLQDCADPGLNSYAETVTRAASLRTSERNSLLAYMGLPLQIFGESSFFSPYTPLQLLDLLMDASTHSFVVGSTNSLLLAQKDRYCDILVNLDEETNKIQIINQDLRSALSLSAADRRWIDDVTQTVLDTWDPDNPSRPNTHGYSGSEDALRLQFEEYILSLLSSAAYKSHYDQQALSDSRTNTEAFYADPAETSNDFNNEFLVQWGKTPNYALFDRLTKNAGIFDIIEPKHPTAGGYNVEDVQRRLAQGVAELHLNDRFREGRETVGRVWGEGRERVGAGVARIWKEVDDFRQRREASQSPGRHSPSKLHTDIEAPTDKSETGYSDSGSAVTPASATTPGSVKGTGGSWAAALRDRASKIQIQRPAIDTAQIGTTAKDNAAKAGQYLSSWGTWARDRSRDWGENRKASGSPGDNQDTVQSTPKSK